MTERIAVNKMSWFDFLKAPKPYRDDSKAKRTEGGVPYYSYDELTDDQKAQADKGTDKRAKEKATERMKDPSLQGRIKRSGKKEARRRLTEEASKDLEDRKGRRAFMVQAIEGGLHGRSRGYDLDNPEQQESYERGYTAAEKRRYLKFRPVQLSKDMRQIISRADKKTDVEAEIKQLFSEYLDDGAKFEAVHLTILNKAGLGMTELVDTVRDNMARRG